ncbi:MAG: hypothetical protein M3162_05610 [Thermoproteota archaeon]|nr:hypothetical protein [Thermoproteota archaeon]
MFAYEIFDISSLESVSEAWLSTVSLLTMVKYSNFGHCLDMVAIDENVHLAKMISDRHLLDFGNCNCGLSYAEHAYVKRTILKFFKTLSKNVFSFIS